MKKHSNDPVISIDEIVRPTRVEVDLKILAENFNKVRKHVGCKIMPILKANAYGHGLVRVAQLYEELKTDYLGVAVVEEGILLREMGIKMPILVLGGVWGNQIPLFLKHNLAITASSIDKLKQIDDTSAQMKIKAKVHLKIDTGMERLGVHHYNAEKFLDAAYNFKNIMVEGIYSHFANSESSDLTHTLLQLERFNGVLEFYNKRSINPPIRHISNSGAILQLPEANLDMVRPGILLFGVYPSDKLKKTVPVEPALTWRSLVVYFKVIKAGNAVGYGLTYKPDHNIRAVTIPVGYGDGYFRSLSNKAVVMIHSKKYPVIGNVSMDQIVVNIENDSAYNGDEVILLGSDGKNSITAEDLAGWAGTIPYEILTNINTRVPRIYLE
ncbi:MAG: alanine racemase [Ignavibacteriaceae bacterium]|jgi:alanine racemase|nr:alanine racemase [Chlorobium sp.]MCW8817800.1 alanine racemase [Ignavibacteriaceae bacterium]MCW8961582.1 alanine racemase [Ignavibacteriaceae bacterium]MCW9097587.1 alanine racemase [Ignavibacteriaceae bacterium]